MAKDIFLMSDQELFIFLNSLNSPFFDPIMIFFSNIPVWIPLYIGVMVWMFLKFGWKIGLAASLTLIIAFACGDQISNFIKSSVGRLRPCHDSIFDGIIHNLENAKGKFGFPSGHATNSICFALLSSLILKNKTYSILIICWSIIVSYSRVYVGVHYPLDILCGAIIGITIALIFNELYKFAANKISIKCGA